MMTEKFLDDMTQEELEAGRDELLAQIEKLEDEKKQEPEKQK